MLELISFVGVDTKTDFNRLVEINRASPIPLEFGVLYSEKQGGKRPRYPTYEECLALLRKLEDYDVLASLHVCGSEAIDNFLEGTDELIALSNKACRIQLNFGINNFDDLDNLATRLIKIAMHRTLIIQNNKSKSSFVNLLKQKDEEQSFSNCSDRFNFLYDASGGVGKPIDKFEPFDDNYFTGYAGGINPENVMEIYHGIESVNKFKDIRTNGYTIGYYLDMESGIRTNDWLDLEKCNSIVESLSKV